LRSRAQRELGTDLRLETCAHYLTHTIDSTGADLGKVAPPLREAADTEAVWAALKAGHIDVVATDHVHRPKSAKAGGIWKASPGFPGLETLLPVLLSEGYQRRGVPLGLITRVLSANPARIMGCRSKGAIAVGQDADLALVDLNRTDRRQRQHALRCRVLDLRGLAIAGQGDPHHGSRPVRLSSRATAPRRSVMDATLRAAFPATHRAELAMPRRVEPADQ
jgi:dihydroorotase-like cyclic amidohydrolase